MYQKHETPNECKEAFLEQFTEAVDSEQPWMAIVFSVDGDQLTIRKTSSSFPHAKFDHALVAMKQVLDKEKILGSTDALWQPGSPLPRRPRLTPDQRASALREIRRDLEEKLEKKNGEDPTSDSRNPPQYDKYDRDNGQEKNDEVVDQTPPVGEAASGTGEDYA